MQEVIAAGVDTMMKTVMEMIGNQRRRAPMLMIKDAEGSVKERGRKNEG